MFQRILIICLLFLISGCATIKEQVRNLKGLSKCSFEINNVDKYLSFKERNGNLFNYVVSIDFNGINPNDLPVKIANYKLELFVNNNLLSELKSSDEIVLSANETTVFNVKAIIAPTDVLSLLWKNLRNKRIEYRVKGTFQLKLGLLSRPISLNLFKFVQNDDK